MQQRKLIISYKFKQNYIFYVKKKNYSTKSIIYSSIVSILPYCFNSLQYNISIKVEKRTHSIMNKKESKVWIEGTQSKAIIDQRTLIKRLLDNKFTKRDLLSQIQCVLQSQHRLIEEPLRLLSHRIPSVNTLPSTFPVRDFLLYPRIVPSRSRLFPLLPSNFDPVSMLAGSP